jgi:hypothetical protein
MNLQEVLIETEPKALPPPNVLYRDIPACLIVLCLVFLVVSLAIVIVWYLVTHPV